jgi:hypothetical protein
MMDEGVLLRGYAELMKWLYSPKEYYSRCEAYLKRSGSIFKTRSTTLGDVGALLRTIWHVGVLSSRRRLFWRLFFKAMLRGRSHLRQAVAHAVKGEHLILYTYEHVVPRIERALAEIHAGIEHAPRPLQFDRSELLAATASASFRTACNVRLPVVQRAKALPLSNHSREAD